jgi:hypothetical protein
MIIYKSDILSVQYVEAQKQLHLTCTGKVSSRSLKSCYRKALVFAKQNQVKHWLFDFSKNYELSEDDQKWLDTSFFPNLMIALGPNNYIGMVVPKLTYRKLYQEAGQTGMQTYNIFIKLKTFCSSPKATKWLTTQTQIKNYFRL